MFQRQLSTLNLKSSMIEKNITKKIFKHKTKKCSNSREILLSERKKNWKNVSADKNKKKKTNMIWE